MEAITVQIAKLELKAGDTLAVMVPQVLSNEQRRYVMEYIKRSGVLPEGVKAMVLDGGATLAKLSAAEAA